MVLLSFGRSQTVLAACRTLEAAERVAADLPRTKAILLDVGDIAALEAAVAEYDVVVSLIPYTYHAAVIKAAIKGKTHVVTTSYVSPAMRELDEEAKKAGIVVMNEIGLDPGIDHLYAVKAISEVHSKGGKVRHLPLFDSTLAGRSSSKDQIKEFTSYSAGLPAPAAANNPLGYKFSGPLEEPCLRS